MDIHGAAFWHGGALLSGVVPQPRDGVGQLDLDAAAAGAVAASISPARAATTSRATSAASAHAASTRGSTAAVSSSALTPASVASH